MASILEETGPPRWRARPSGFPGLARIIVEQQLSVASANAILARVNEATDDLSPEGFLVLGEEGPRALGLSRPKIRYIRALAEQVTSGTFDFSDLGTLPEDEASAKLEALLGVGRWTAAVYLLFCEGRRDLWPKGDVALLAAHQMAGGSFGRADLKTFDSWAEEAYAPHRGTAAHILWGKIAFERGRAPL
ncbi:DNA-3-methyladenine glycosylase 2 family protein [Parvularcula sp. ZS-1/3]|uniref:DNA-3-methyladenine glycosylase II n=1 Tax=Parvularcula mediterranea TaxID=2732508 RepID=A0A7Y3RJ37_9PROT|nr:DNA-3-methyladenine glycosylase 2 family protein [Parvularcula mediterranea]NNU14956.1 DNA-3-methyladenine glycosylase 2 family protein [Parvularcula mediterranea]